MSDHLREQILAKASELNYHCALPRQNSEVSAGTETPYSVAVAVCRPETSIFWTSIIHRVAQELSQHDVNLVYVYLPYCPAPDYVLPSTLSSASVQGMIVLNVYDGTLLHLLTGLSLPKVFLDTSAHIPVARLGGDLMMMENTVPVRQITEHLISQGRKKIGFIGDIHYAKSNLERYDGYVSAMEAHRLPISPCFLLTGPFGPDSYQEEISLAVEQLPELPDAFVCVNDYVGGILLQTLLQKNVKIPYDVAVSGFDDNAENPLSATLSTVRVFNLDIGRRLAMQILYRMEHPDARFETIYISSQLVLRESTEGNKPDT